MYITDSLIEFLNNSRVVLDSTIVLTDLEHVVFAASDNNDCYLDKALSDSLKDILNLFMADISTVDYLNTSMDSVVPIFNGDDISKYKSQIFLPVFHYDAIVGLLIFIADNRVYIPSSLKCVKTTLHFVQIFSTEDYL